MSYTPSGDGDIMLSHIAEAQMALAEAYELVVDTLHTPPANPLHLIAAIGQLVKPLSEARDALAQAEAIRLAASKRSLAATQRELQKREAIR